MKQRYLGLLLLLTLALLNSGCGPQFATVNGKITFQGKPIPFGTITFTDRQGKTASGVIENGEYQLERVPTGRVVVTVVALPQPPPVVCPTSPPKETSPHPISPPPVPERYGDVQKTPLSVVIDSAVREYNADLTP